MWRFLWAGMAAVTMSALAVVATSASKDARNQARASTEEKAEPAVVRSAECRWAGGPIMIDGKLNEAAWQKAQVLKDFAVYWQSRPAKTATKARLLWDNDYLYFAAEMEDTDLYADIQERNGTIWFNDVFELFFKPAQEQLAYYEFQVSAANTQLELFFPSRGSGGYHRFAPLTKLGMNSAVQLQGTLNNWQDKDTGWTVEGRIPLAAFEISGQRPQAGARWRFALCRYDYSAAFERPEISSTAPLTEPEFHRYEDYGELLFVGPPR
jgi:hypothetical protein